MAKVVVTFEDDGDMVSISPVYDEGRVSTNARPTPAEVEAFCAMQLVKFRHGIVTAEEFMDSMREIALYTEEVS